MIDSSKLEKIKNLFSNEKFVEEIKKIESIEDIKKSFVENEIDLTDEELDELLRAVVECSKKDEIGELSEEQMENVTGGSWTLAIVAGVVFAAFGGTAAYKIRQFLGV